MAKQQNKKNFAEGLENMFQHTLLEDNLKDNPSHLGGSDEKTSRQPKKRNHHKSFSDNLESFLNDTIEEVIDEKVEEIKTQGKASKQKRASKPEIGLDLLIRSTLEDSQLSDVNSKQRLTFSFDREKVERLKNIAEAEHQRIRDIIDELVTTYISTYKPKIANN